VSIAVERPASRVHALDLSGEALALARENAARHGVAQRIEFRVGDLAAPPADWLGSMDLVVSNPPYVAEAEWRALAPEVRDFEPKLALVPGPTGDEAYPPLARAAFALLRPGGRFVAELGHTSAPGASAGAHAAGLAGLRVIDDLAGIARILTASKPRAGGSS
jgi:release factor glutamine methyltransferase